jgi:hypothetical protein
MNKFITYLTDSDTEIYVSYLNDKIQTVTKNEFVFIGFRNGISPYHRKKYNWIKQILLSKGINLNIIEVPTEYDISDNIDDGFVNYKDLKFPSNYLLKRSEDDSVYILFQDVEIGRGWACLIKNEEMLEQEHRDIILDNLMEGDFIKSFNINYEAITLEEDTYIEIFINNLNNK